MLPIATKAEIAHPKILLIVGQPKVGKTTALSMLPNNLIIDLEDGSDYIDGIKVNLIKNYKKGGKHPNKQLTALHNAIQDENKKLQGYAYDFISIDTITALEDIAREVATAKYKASIVGRSFAGTDIVAELSKGAGYLWWRKALEEMLFQFAGLAKYGLILTGHAKQGSNIREGVEFSANDIVLTGQNKNIICSKADAIGVMFRSKDDPLKLIISFKTNDRDLITGARNQYLQNQTFPLVEVIENKLVSHWDKIYPLNKNKE